MAWREDRRRFWTLIATGLSSEDAAVGGGVAAGRVSLNLLSAICQAVMLIAVFTALIGLALPLGFVATEGALLPS